MTDAVEAALSRRASGAKVSADVDDVDAALTARAGGKKLTAPTPPANFGYGRGGRAPTDQEMRERRDNGLTRVVEGAIDNPMGTLNAGAAGVNRGVANLAGLPVDTVANVIDLGGMAYGATRAALSGRPADEFYTPVDRSQHVGSGDWNARMLDAGGEALGQAPVTQNPSPDNPAARLMYNIGQAVPGALTARGMAANAAGGTAQTIVAEAGGDPAMQAAAGMMGGHAASPQSRLNAAASSQSMGAAGSAVDLQKLSPNLRAAVEKAVQKTGGAVNEEALARHLQADSLPVKVSLSEGQALGDGSLLSKERNLRGKHKAYQEGFEAQNTALTENLRVMRDQAGPEVFSTNPVEHADTLIARYKDIDKEVSADISAKYKALRDAAGGDFPIDTSALLGNVQGALGKQLLTHDAPPSVMRTLEELSQSGTMTFEQFENLRSNLARIQRSHSVDGNTRFAAGIIRDQMEQIPMTGAAADLKPLADQARAAARERFAALEADPAYKAAVEDSVPPDRFVQKFVVGGTRDNVSKLAEAMGGDGRAAQTLKVATLDHLRKSAGIDPNYNGRFTQAGYNKALQALEPKMAALLDPQTTETARNLGDVARYTQFQPEGSFVNNSNTFVAAAAEHGADMLEGAANVKAGGIPVGSWVRNAITDRGANKRAAETFAPGAGLTKLNELLKGKGNP